MRLEVGFLKEHEYGASVFVNGTECHGVFIADEEQGYVEKYVYNEDGSLKVNYEKGEIETEIIYGNVKILLPQDKVNGH